MKKTKDGRRHFSRQFKVAAVRRVMAGESLTGVARELDIGPDLLWRWRKRVTEKGEEHLRGIGQRASEERSPETEANAQQKRIADLAVKYRLPAISDRDDFVANGGLMSYGADDSERFKRVAVFVDKVLKGTKPADIPVEQPKKFEFIINLKAAKQIGLTIPPNVLARADKVIK